MAVLFSPWGNQQFFDENGAPATGWKIYTYAAGSSTPLATYTTSAGSVAQANPIVLSSLGFVDNPIWLTSGLAYKLVLTNAADVVKGPPEDNITGVTGTSSTSQWQASGLTPTYVSATSFTLAGDQTAVFHVGRRLETTNTAGTFYSTISASAYGALTTVTVINDGSSVLDSGLSQVSLGLITALNTSLPRIGPTVQVITATGTYTKPTGVRRIRVRLVGGGGGGGVSGAANQASGGGGGGGYSEELIDASSITTVAVTIGAGGLDSGTNGGTTSFGAYLQATGGVAGSGGSGTTGASNGGAGGVGSGGDINAAGSPGGANSNSVHGGPGGASLLGGGGTVGHNGGTGVAGGAYGGGGSGGGNNATTVGGGAGAAGVVIVEEFY